MKPLIRTLSSSSIIFAGGFGQNFAVHRGLSYPIIVSSNHIYAFDGNNKFYFVVSCLNLMHYPRLWQDIEALREKQKLREELSEY